MAQREATTVKFTIESATLSAQEIERRLGLKPDAIWTLGAARGAFGAKAKSHGFVLESSLPPSNSYEQHLREMSRRLLPVCEKVQALAAAVEVELLLSLHKRNAPLVELSRDHMRLLAVMNARLRIDLQIVGDRSRGAPAATEGGDPPAPAPAS